MRNIYCYPRLVLKFVIILAVVNVLAVRNNADANEIEGSPLLKNNQSSTSKEAASECYINEKTELLASIKRLTSVSSLNLENIENEFHWPVTYKMEISDMSGRKFVRTSFNYCPKFTRIPLAEFVEDKKFFWMTIPKKLICIRKDDVLREFGAIYKLFPPVAIDDFRTSDSPQLSKSGVTEVGQVYSFEKSETRLVLKFGFFFSECLESIYLNEEPKGKN